jgi:hypothetical protein
VIKVQAKAKKTPLPWWRRILMALLLTAIVLLAALMFADYLARRKLGAEVLKINKAGEPVTFRRLEPPDETPDVPENAAVFYTRAIESINPDNIGNMARANAFYRKELATVPLDKFPGDMKNNISQSLVPFTPVLKTFEHAGNMDLPSFDIGVKRGIKHCTENLRRAQAASFLLSLQTLDFILKNKDDDAAQSIITMLKTARIFETYPTSVVHAAKMGIINLACQDTQLLLLRGKPSQQMLQKLYKALSESIAPDALEKMLITERVYQLENIRNYLPDSVTEKLMQKEVPEIPERTGLSKSAWKRMRIRQKATVGLREFAHLIGVARLPWPQPLDAVKTETPKANEKAKTVISSISVLIRLTAETVLAVNSTSLMIAVERYQIANGKLPDSVDDLVGDYIDTVPLNPFTGQKITFSKAQKNNTSNGPDAGQSPPPADTTGDTDNKNP